MQHLIIIGARGAGRECFCAYTMDARYGKTFVVKGFLDDKSDALDAFDGYAPILSSPEAYVPEPDDVFVCALGSSFYRKKYTEMMLAKGASFMTTIHPTAIVHPSAKIGSGVRVGAYCSISADARIGDFCVVQPFCDIGHDARVGDWCSLGAYSFMGGFSCLEEGVTLHTRGTILPHVRVGAWATVGAGAVCIRKVKAGTTVYGNPATRLKW